MKNLQNLGIDDIIDIVRRRVWYWLIPSVVLSIGGFIYIWNMPSIYTSETTIRVATRMVPEEYIGSVVRESVAERMEFVRQQLQSRTFLSQVAQEFNMGGISPGFQPMPPNVFKLSYTTTDPDMAQMVVRRLAERVIQLNENFRRGRVETVDQFLDEELRQAAARLIEAEDRMREFNDRNFRGMPQQVDANAIIGLQNQLASVASSRATLEQTRNATLKRLEEQRQLLQSATNASPPAPPVATASQASPLALPAPLAAPPTATEQALAQKQRELEGHILRYGRYSQHPRLAATRRQVEQLEAQVKLEKQRAPQSGQSPQAQTPQTAPMASNPPAVDDTPSVIPPLPGMVSSISMLEADIRDEIGRLDAQIAVTLRNEQELAGRIAQYQRRLNLPPELSQEMAELDRQLKAARDTHTLLFNRKLTSDLAGKVDTSDSNQTFAIIDAANRPNAPSGPQRQRLALFAVLGSLIAGFGLAFARELADSTIRDEEEALTTLKLPVLTSIPVIGPQNGGLKWLRASNNPDIPLDTSAFVPVSKNGAGLMHSDNGAAGRFSLLGSDPKIRSVVMDAQTAPGEQYRLIRTTLSLMQRKREKFKTVLMASTIPNEGKTFSACCLASVLAQDSGKKVLLIDADLRTASASRTLGLGVASSDPGFGEMLQGTAALEHCLKECEELNLYFLPSGNATNHPTELLGTPALEKIIRECEEIFDWIIIDSPPVLALADATLLLSVADTAVLVVHAESTPAKLIQDSIKRIGPDRICGILMNQVHRITSTYYYNDYYKARKE